MMEELIAIAPASLRSNALTYVATAAWLGSPLESIPRPDALSWLAGGYLRAFGPARVVDFGWWSGSTAAEAKAAIASVATVDIGSGWLLPAGDRGEFADIEPAPGDALDLLPLWDACTMGYAPDGRARLVDREHHERAYGSGDGRALVVRGGRAVAAWGLRFAGPVMEVTIDWFDPPADEHARAVGERLAGVARLLGARSVSVRTGPLEGRGAPAG